MIRIAVRPELDLLEMRLWEVQGLWAMPSHTAHTEASMIQTTHFQIPCQINASLSHLDGPPPVKAFRLQILILLSFRNQSAIMCGLASLPFPAKDMLRYCMCLLWCTFTYLQSVLERLKLVPVHTFVRGSSTAKLWAQAGSVHCRAGHPAVHKGRLSYSKYNSCGWPLVAERNRLWYVLTWDSDCRKHGSLLDRLALVHFHMPRSYQNGAAGGLVGSPVENISDREQIGELWTVVNATRSEAWKIWQCHIFSVHFTQWRAYQKVTSARTCRQMPEICVRQFVFIYNNCGFVCSLKSVEVRLSGSVMRQCRRFRWSYW